MGLEQPSNTREQLGNELLEVLKRHGASDVDPEHPLFKEFIESAMSGKLSAQFEGMSQNELIAEINRLSEAGKSYNAPAEALERRFNIFVDANFYEGIDPSSAGYTANQDYFVRKTVSGGISGTIAKVYTPRIADSSGKTFGRAPYVDFYA